MEQILLVEDDEAMADSLIFALEAEQFTVRHAATLEECKRELWVVFYLQSNKIAFEYQSVIF